MRGTAHPTIRALSGCLRLARPARLGLASVVRLRLPSLACLHLACLGHTRLGLASVVRLRLPSLACLHLACLGHTRLGLASVVRLRLASLACLRLACLGPACLRLAPLRPVLLRPVLLCLSILLWGPDPVHGQDPQEMATVQGVVVEHETGEFLEGALVELDPMEGAPGKKAAETTGEKGLFYFGEVAPGLYDLRVTLMSYHDLHDTLRVFAESDLELTLPLSISPVPLDPIVVVSSRLPVWPMRAFETRRQTASGVFFTREEIRAAGIYEFTDLLRRIPGARVLPTGGFGQRVEFRGGCRPDIWVDGVLAGTTADLNSFLRTEDLEGVEVYKGAELPMEFGSNLCGAIVAWTAPGGRSPGDDEEGGTFWKRAVAGVGLLILGWLAIH